MSAALPSIADLLATMTDAQRQGALQMLDAVSRPMQPREIEALLRAKGIGSSRAKVIASVVKHFHLIALLGPEDAPVEPRAPMPTVVEVKRRVIPRRTQ